MVGRSGPGAPAARRGNWISSGAHGSGERYPLRCQPRDTKEADPWQPRRIASFADLELHMDTPVKRYSSGMLSRLTFATAVLFPADIYLFDEVLAMVDAEFQRRCLDEIRKLSDAGRTVIFVSHDLDQVASTCDRVMWLHSGQLREVGPTRRRFLARTFARAPPRTSQLSELRFEIVGKASELEGPQSPRFALRPIPGPLAIEIGVLMHGEMLRQRAAGLSFSLHGSDVSAAVECVDASEREPSRLLVDHAVGLDDSPRPRTRAG